MQDDSFEWIHHIDIVIALSYKYPPTVGAAEDLRLWVPGSDIDSQIVLLSGLRVEGGEPALRPCP